MYGSSYLVYISTLLVSLLLSLIYTKQNNIIIRIFKRKISINNITLWVLTAVLAIIAGGRSFSVGIDTQSYITWQFEYINNYGFNSGTMPFIARLFVYVILYFTTDYHFIYLFFAFLTNAFVIFRMKDFKNESNFVMLIFGYVCSCYLSTFNTWRQLLAVSIIFYATKYAFKKKYLKYSAFVVLAILVHSSAIMGLLIIPVDLFIHVPNDSRRKMVRLTLLLAPVILFVMFFLIYRYFDWQRYVYHFYHYGTTNNVGLMAITRLSLLLYMGMVCLKRTNIIINKSIYLAAFSILLMSLDYFIVYAGRLSFYFVLFEPIVYGTRKEFLKNKKAFQIAKYCYVLLGIYTFMIGLINNGNGVIPYSFWGI